MKTTQTVLMIAAFVALTSGCASTMSARNGEFAVSGNGVDPVQATYVAGGVTTNQYRAETDRIIAEKMLDKGMNPGYGAYGNGLAPVGGYGGGSDYWFYYRNVVGQQQTAPAPPPNAVMPQGAVTVPEGYATQQDLQRVEEKADDSLCMHYKAKLRSEGKPITPCPPIKK
jgi:hypothetical protein